MIEVRIEKDSIAPSGIRLTTFVLKYPRFIHAEMLTHRVFSRNASSSRAIPLQKQLDELQNNIAYPEIFHKNTPGMQGKEPLDEKEQEKARVFWKLAAQNAINSAKLINQLDPKGVHKQTVNRLLEPFLHISVIVTATDYDNFFKLRYHKDAQPEMYSLAKEMFKHYNGSKPAVLREGEWHLPFVSDDDQNTLSMSEQIYKSVACCARVSYNNHDGSTPTLEQNEQLYNRLLGSDPKHCSPAEHLAMALGDPRIISGNFRGWQQYRQTLEKKNGN